MQEQFSIRVAPDMPRTLRDFLQYTGDYRNGTKTVCFVRFLGISAGLSASLTDADRQSTAQNAGYCRINGLPRSVPPEDTAFYADSFSMWQTAGCVKLRSACTPALSRVYADACRETARLFRSAKPSATDTMEKNFLMKLWYWTDTFLAPLLRGWSFDRRCRLIASGLHTEQEYLFAYLAVQFGCDVCLLQTQADIECAPFLRMLSDSVTLGNFGNVQIPDYKPAKSAVSRPSAGQTAANAPSSQPRLKIPEHPRRRTQTPPPPRPAACSTTTTVSTSAPRCAPAAPVSSGMPQRGNPAAPHLTASAQPQEKSYEELAALAASVVMIGVHDMFGEIRSSGSGIMIGKDGFILTNCHVISKGKAFSVRIENDEQVYATHEIIKYHPTLDLAILRINRLLDPLPVYRNSKPLVRGQKVFTIGSPMGLFNSVSDGIIAGFREIDDVNMIQFTAPISHGSSGGALLNTSGELIGISSAGIDSGQNLNLAVGYEDILMFCRGFI